MAGIKEEAHRLLDDLPNDSTWDELMERIYVHQAVEAGLRDSLAGRTTPVEEVRRQFSLEP